MKTILVVDDEPDVLEAVRDALESEGYGVTLARNGQEALDRLRAGSAPNLVLLDWMMPVVDGRAFCAARAADARLLPIPVLLLSADVRAMAEAKAAGVTGVVQKPVSIEDLIEAIERFATPER